MIRPIVTDTILLQQKSIPATKNDLPIVTDLIDTITAHKDHCVGMAANMIGVHKRIIVICIQDFCLPMINPILLKTEGNPYQAEEGCLSLTGTKNATRFPKITVTYLDQNFEQQTQTFTDFYAQVIQHELDHCDGILI